MIFQKIGPKPNCGSHFRLFRENFTWRNTLWSWASIRAMAYYWTPNFGAYYARWNSLRMAWNHYPSLVLAQIFGKSYARESSKIFAWPTGLVSLIKCRFSIASANCFNMCYKQFMHKLIESCIHILILMMHHGCIVFLHNAGGGWKQNQSYAGTRQPQHKQTMTQTFGEKLNEGLLGYSSYLNTK